MTKQSEKCQLNKKTKASYKNDCLSPDSSGILFLAPLARKRYSG